MEILKGYFDNVKLFDRLLLGVPNTGFFPKEELKTFKFEYGNSKLFELESDSVKRMILDHKLKPGQTKEDGWVYRDPSDIENIVLPSHWLYIHFNPKIPASNPNDGREVHFTSVFVSRTTICFFLEVTDIVTKAKISVPNIIYHKGKWTHIVEEQSQMISFILFSIDLINSYQTVVVDRTTEPKYNIKCQLWNKKRLVKTPSAYYKVSLRNNKIIEEDEEDDSRIRVGRQKNFAYFVRGCHVHRIKKGELPIDPTVEKQLKKDSRRKIFLSSDEIDEESLEVLQDHGIRVGDKEWVAILKTRRSSYIANSKDGKNPYIPSIHSNV